MISGHSPAPRTVPTSPPTGARCEKVRSERSSWASAGFLEPGAVVIMAATSRVWCPASNAFGRSRPRVGRPGGEVGWSYPRPAASASTAALGRVSRSPVKSPNGTSKP